MRYSLRPRGAAVTFFVAVLAFLVLFALLRTMLLWRMGGLHYTREPWELVRAFSVGARFDLRMAVYGCLPLIFSDLIRGPRYSRFCLAWLTTFGSLYLFLGLVELEFYAEFQQRLNSLVFVYIREDFETVARMIWEGLPVVTYLSGWLVLLFLSYRFFRFVIERFMWEGTAHRRARHVGTTLVLFLVAVLCARGTVRAGPPLRWGDAFTSDDMFINHLSLNGSYTLSKAAMEALRADQESRWQDAMPDDSAMSKTRDMLLTEHDELIDEGVAPVRRLHSPTARPIPSTPNIVIILMESFAGQYVGALGNDQNVTPEFDRLTKEGVLFRRMFSNGTHTHQGIFATLACFPNLPGHEYLMQEPEGRNHFSGLTRLLPDFSSVFVYNGDFNWDNQTGFFRNQGVDRMVGRFDYENPIHVDPAWGVSDEDMFARSVLELDRIDRPFVAYLQTLSNHLPYNLPEPLPFEPVAGDQSQRLTAMKYSDWALGEFFRQIRDKAYFDNTIFVIVGDHGFGNSHQLTEVNLLRFHVPLLLIAPGLAPDVVDTVASQVDIIPTILGLTGRTVQHQCWGRDLFDLAPSDPGFAVIKPSGNEPTVAIVEGERLVTFDYERNASLYRYNLKTPDAQSMASGDAFRAMQDRLHAYVQTAMNGLQEDTIGPE